jgi:hypothetical protein
MLGLMLYAIVCFTIAAAVTWLSVLFTKVGNSAEKPAIFRLVFIWVFVAALPYAWVEFCTARYGKEFKGDVEYAAEKGLLDGDFAYIKVRYPFGDTARVIAVTDAKDTWGGVYRNTYNLEFERTDDGWHLREIDALNTKDGDAAGFSVPPYW